MNSALLIATWKEDQAISHKTVQELKDGTESRGTGRGSVDKHLS